MATSKSKKSNQKYYIVAVGLILALVGYFGYRSILAPSDINMITDGGGGGGKKTPAPTPKATRKATPKAAPKVTTVPKQTTQGFGWNYSTGKPVTAEDWNNPHKVIPGTYVAPNGKRYNVDVQASPR